MQSSFVAQVLLMKNTALYVYYNICCLSTSLKTASSTFQGGNSGHRKFFSLDKILRSRSRLRYRHPSERTPLSSSLLPNHSLICLSYAVRKRRFISGIPTGASLLLPFQQSTSPDNHAAVCYLTVHCMVEFSIRLHTIFSSV